MKYQILSLFILLAFSVNAQVGINTQSPVGIFHVDAGSTPAVSADDVLIDKMGNIGLGTHTPKTKVDIQVGTPGTGLRIVDGTQNNGRMLLSDANGNSRWGMVKGSGGYTKSISWAVTFPHAVETKIPIFGNSTTNTAHTRIPITEAGNYLITIRWWGRTNLVAANQISAYFNLYRNASRVDNIEYYLPYTQAGSPFTFTVSLVASNCVGGDYLEVRVMPSVGGGVWTLNSPTSDPDTSITVFMM